jgi:hypothetical protein
MAAGENLETCLASPVVASGRSVHPRCPLKRHWWCRWIVRNGRNRGRGNPQAPCGPERLQGWCFASRGKPRQSARPMPIPIYHDSLNSPRRRVRGAVINAGCWRRKLSMDTKGERSAVSRSCRPCLSVRASAYLQPSLVLALSFLTWAGAGGR